MNWIKNKNRIDNLNQVESFTTEKNELVMYLRGSTRVVLEKYKTPDEALAGIERLKKIMCVDTGEVIDITDKLKV